MYLKDNLSAVMLSLILIAAAAMPSFAGNEAAEDAANDIQTGYGAEQEVFDTCADEEDPHSEVMCSDDKESQETEDSKDTVHDLDARENDEFAEETEDLEATCIAVGGGRAWIDESGLPDYSGEGKYELISIEADGREISESDLRSKMPEPGTRFVFRFEEIERDMMGTEVSPSMDAIYEGVSIKGGSHPKEDGLR